jgi:predicted permease
VSAGFFRVLGVPPALGREFTTDEDQVGGRAVVVLSHALWVRAFAADAAVLGRDVTLRGEPFTVVGVMPARFRATTPADLWTPLRPSTEGEGAGQNYEIYARLRPGAVWADVKGEVESVGARLIRERFQVPPDVQLSMRLLPLQELTTEDMRQPLLVLWAAVGIVLLIGCANIAGLMLVRASARTTEIATRIALGGGRASIIRQLLAESAVLATCGGAAGIGLGYALSRTLSVRLADITTLPTTPDLRVLLIATAASLFTSLVFGLLPAFQASRTDVRGMLVETGGASIAGAARHWPSRLLVVGQVALGIVLLVGAGLVIRTFAHLTRLEPGFDPRNVTTGTVSLQDARYQTAAKVNDLFARSLERIRLTPGVERAAIALTLPYERALNNGWRFAGEATGRPEVISLTYVTPEYFDALRIPVAHGRVFSDGDTAASPRVVVVNETFVSRYSRDADPIGRRLQLGAGAPPVEIIGVVGPIQQRVNFGNSGPVTSPPAAYVPASQVDDAGFRIAHTWFNPSWIVRASVPRATVVPAMQQALREIDPLLPFNKFRTIDDVRNEAVMMARVQAALLGALAVIALLLCSLGVYGLVANSVAERRREFGVRMALGATSLQIIKSATGPALALSVGGAVGGLLLAAAGARVMQQLVFGVSVGDPLTFGLAGGIVIVTACVAALVPVMRTLRTNVVATLNNR